MKAGKTWTMSGSVATYNGPQWSPAMKAGKTGVR